MTEHDVTAHGVTAHGVTAHGVTAPEATLRSRLPLFMVAVPVIIALDQWTKALIGNAFKLYETKIILPGLFNIQYFHNPGMAFGLFADVEHPLRRPFLITLVICTIGIVVYLFLTSRRPSRLFTIALSLITGGAVGNLVDRLRVGYVTDFLQLHIRDYYWPAFNVADSVIFVGVALLAFEMLWREPRLDKALAQHGKNAAEDSASSPETI